METLDVSNNNLSVLPPGVIVEQLKTLKLSGNTVVESVIPHEVYRNGDSAIHRYLKRNRNSLQERAEHILLPTSTWKAVSVSNHLQSKVEKSPAQSVVEAHKNRVKMKTYVTPAPSCQLLMERRSLRKNCWNRLFSTVTKYQWRWRIC